MRTKCRVSNSFSLFVIAIVLLVFSLPALAKTVTHIKEYTYQASELDSKLSSRTIALEQVKRLLLEELGAYLVSETDVRNFELTKDRVSSLTAGIVMTVIVEERWDGKSYFLKAKITADTDELVRSIDHIRKDQEQSGSLEGMTKKTERALKEIEHLKKESGNVEGEKGDQEKYAKAVNELTAIDWFKKGNALRHSRNYDSRTGAKNSQEALKAYDKAIEVDPGFAEAYAGRAGVYNDWGQYQEALRESEEAIRIDPTLAWAFNQRGWAHIGLFKYQKAVEDLNKAIELDPRYAWAYCNRSWAYHLLKDYHQALEDANRAIEITPGLSNAYFRKGRALDSLKRFQEAVKSFDKAVELNPTFSWALLQRGHTLFKLNKTEEGMEDLKKAANLGNKDAQNYLTRKGVQW